MTKKTLFLGGVPTESDVRLLFEQVSTGVGAVIRYDNLLELLTIPERNNRFKTIVSAWRRRLYRDRNVVLIPVPGIGFQVADPSERIVAAKAKARSGFRSIRRASDVALKTDTADLTPEEKNIRGHLVQVVGTMAALERAQAKPLQLGLTGMDAGTDRGRRG